MKVVLIILVVVTVIAAIYTVWLERQLENKNRSGKTRGNFVYLHPNDEIYPSCFSTSVIAHVLDLIHFEMPEKDCHLDGIYLKYYAKSNDGKFLIRLHDRAVWVKPESNKKDIKSED